jgi:hypothetical protein
MPDDDLQYVYTTVARPSRSLPGGAIEEAMYRVVDDTVVLYDRSGKTILAKKQIVQPFDARETAIRLLKHRPAVTRSFNRPIRYQKLYY